jgi:Arc/MetJ-type ribon-helix-helix transcriptional regulator
MVYALPPDLQSLLAKHFALGNYDSEEDVLRDALHALDDRQAVLQDIQLGIADLEAGRGRSLEDVDARLRQKFNIPRAS